MNIWNRPERKDTDKDYFQEYFEKISQIRDEMEANGEGQIRHKDIHAGQVLLYAMAADAKAKASAAKDKAETNTKWIRVLTAVVFTLVVFQVENLPIIINLIGKLLGIL